MWSPATSAAIPCCAEPLNCMDSVVCMGAGFSAGMGIAKSFEKEGVTGKVVFGVVGDSTFFHSGMTGAAEIVYNKGRMIPACWTTASPA